MPTDEGRALMAELDDVDDQHREVFARFGLAVYMAQVFEHGAVNLLCVLDMAEGRLTSADEVDAHFDQLFADMLGKHVRRLTNRGTLERADLDLCTRALAARNRLAHRYWREEIVSMATEAGRQRMVDDLDAGRALFQGAIEALDRVLFAVGAALGFTPERVAEAAEQMRAQAQGEV